MRMEGIACLHHRVVECIWRRGRPTKPNSLEGHNRQVQRSYQNFLFLPQNRGGRRVDLLSTTWKRIAN